MSSMLAAMVIVATMSFDDAKMLADADEASLSPAETRILVKSQAIAAHDAFETCVDKSGLRVLPSFAIVMRLDLSGRVVQTWRQGGGEFGACVQERFGAAQLFKPPNPVFYTSFVFTFETKT